jgi:hypothetical protein
MKVMKRFGAVATGALVGFALTFCVLLASMLLEPPAYDADRDPLPNFRAGNFEWRVMYIGIAFFGAAIVGGLGGGIIGRLLAFLASKKDVR